MFSMDSSFWRYKIYADIRGVFVNFLYKFSLDLRMPCSHICRSSDSPNYRSKNSNIMTCEFQDEIPGGGLFKRAVHLAALRATCTGFLLTFVSSTLFHLDSY